MSFITVRIPCAACLSADGVVQEPPSLHGSILPRHDRQCPDSQALHAGARGPAAPFPLCLYDRTSRTVRHGIVCHRMCRHVLRRENGQMAPQAARPSEGICRLRRFRTGSMCRAAVVHPVRHRLIYPSGCPVLSLRQSPGRMGGPGQEALPVGTSG
ncbi:hypothetical protein [Bacteroides ovatus]|uniref:hypothetical protein n=1 Tax=Bacteroides ovatus TaxID=28116 RepID=UPI0039B51310